MIGLTILAVFAVGYLVAIPIVYRMLANNQLAQKHKSNSYGGSKRLESIDMIGSAAGATVISLGWWLALPFCVAFVVRHGRRPNPEQEADRLTEDFQHATELRLRLANARKELAQETTASETNPQLRYRARRSPFLEGE